MTFELLGLASRVSVGAGVRLGRAERDLPAVGGPARIAGRDSLRERRPAF